MSIPLLILACASPEPIAAPEPEPPAAAPAPVASIGGEPILHRPIVLGAISTDAVVAGVDSHRAQIDSCYIEALKAEPTLAGRLSVRFRIAPDGSVTEARTKGTSLRHPATEQCVTDEIRKLSFPALERGGVAIVTYPFTFGA